MKLPPIIMERLADIVPDQSAAGGSESHDGWLSKARGQARTRLAAAGLPSRRDEYWRFTDPAGFLETAPPRQKRVLEGPRLLADAHDVYVADGTVRLPEQPKPDFHAIRINELRHAVNTGQGKVRELFGALEADAQKLIPRGLAAVNSGFAQEGLYIECDGHGGKPVQLLHHSAGGGARAFLHHVVHVAPGAELRIIESGIPADWSNSVFEINVSEGAVCHFVRAQGNCPEAVSAASVFVRVADRGGFNLFSLTAQSPWTRNECVVRLTGDSARTNLSGAALGMGKFHHDDTVLVIHEGERCESRQVFKKVLREGAIGVFQGKILVRPGAQKTDGYQISQGLLLDETAQFLAKPELEIYADDVACSHGSTSGGVDELALFYLRSRGLNENEAQEVLALAFLADAIAEVDGERLRDSLIGLANDWFPRRK